MPLPVVRLFSNKMCRIDLQDAGPGFTLPANIGDLGPEITQLNLSQCNLTGADILRCDLSPCVVSPVRFSYGDSD